MLSTKTSKEMHSQRVFFNQSFVSDEFFQELYNHYGSWKTVGARFDLYKSKLERLRYGQVSLSYSLFLRILESFPSKKKTYFLSNISFRDKYWGCSLGGKVTYKKHKEIFEKGRKLGCLKTKYTFDFTMPLTVELCEFIGAFIGDGYMGNSGNVHVVQITGHKQLDKNYYNFVLLSHLKKISSNVNPLIFETKDALRLNVNSKEFCNLLNKRFHFPYGSKTYSVVIPEEIIYSNDPFLINSCLRGIFDTDGCVAFDRRQVYSTPYMRIILHMKSKKLIQQVYSLLNKQQISATITNDLEKVQINGFENCKKFVQKIGFSNERHMKKLSEIGMVG